MASETMVHTEHPWLAIESHDFETTGEVHFLCKNCGRDLKMVTKSGIVLRQKSREFIEVHRICMTHIGN